MGDMTEIVRLLKERTDPADATQAAQVRAALTKLGTDAAAARALATQFRGSTGTQKNAIVADRFDDVLESLADTYDIIAKLIRAVVREQSG